MNKLASFAGHFSVALFMAVSLTGCVVIGGDHDWDDNGWASRQKENRLFINELALDVKRSYVVDKLGAPNFSEAFVKDSDEYRILYYRTQRRQSDGETTKDETTPLVFKNDRLIGWGEGTLEKLNSTN